MNPEKVMPAAFRESVTVWKGTVSWRRPCRKGARASFPSLPPINADFHWQNSARNQESWESTNVVYMSHPVSESKQ